MILYKIILVLNCFRYTAVHGAGIFSHDSGVKINSLLGDHPELYQKLSREKYPSLFTKSGKLLEPEQFVKEVKKVLALDIRALYATTMVRSINNFMYINLLF